MQVLTNAQVTEWVNRFKTLSLETGERLNFDETGPFFTHPEASCIHLDYPAKLERLPFFARYLATLGYESWHFGGALLWVTNWGVWNDLDEGIGYRVIESMNSASGQPSSFEVSQGHSFRADELVETVGMLMQPMIFGWDAYYRASWAYGVDEFFLHVSHDSYVTVVTRTKEFHDRVFAELQKVDLPPTRGNDRQLSRFCRRG